MQTAAVSHLPMAWYDISLLRVQTLFQQDLLVKYLAAPNWSSMFLVMKKFIQLTKGKNPYQLEAALN